MGRPHLSLNLTDDESTTLTAWARAAKQEMRIVQRARIVLLYEEGHTWEHITSATGISGNNGRKWIARFRTERLEGLRDLPRCGKPPTISAETKTKIVAAACEKPDDGSTKWSQRRLAAKLGVSKTTVQKVLAETAVKPHKTEYWCGKSPDPEFEEKMTAIVGLYLDPPENALVLAVDEKSQIQALDRTQPELPLKPGQARRLTATYKRHGTTCLLASLAVHEGTVEARCRDRNSHEEFLKFLKHLYRKHPFVQLHVICDNLSTHKHKAVKEWVAKRRRLTLHFTPTYSSWLNQVEIFFNILTRAVVKDGVWQSKKELVNQLLTFIKCYNQKATPFKWTYTGKPLAA